MPNPVHLFSLVYLVQTPRKRKTGKAVAVDMGEIHPIVSHDREQPLIYNGRLLRALRQYVNKFKVPIQSKMDRCKHHLTVGIDSAVLRRSD